MIYVSLKVSNSSWFIYTLKEPQDWTRRSWQGCSNHLFTPAIYTWFTFDPSPMRIEVWPSEKHRKYDINTPRLCPREACDLSLAHFPASIYPGKTFPTRLQEGLPPASSPSSHHHAATHAAFITKKKEMAPGRIRGVVSCAIASGSANTHHDGYTPLLFPSK